MNNIWTIPIENEECSFISDDPEVAFHLAALVSAGQYHCVNFETKEAFPPLSSSDLVDISDFCHKKFNCGLYDSVLKVRRSKCDLMIKALKSLAMCAGSQRYEYEQSLESLTTVEEQIAYKRNWASIHKNGGYKLMIIAADIIAGLEGEF